MISCFLRIINSERWFRNRNKVFVNFERENEVIFIRRFIDFSADKK